MKPDYRKNAFTIVPPIHELNTGSLYAITLNPKWDKKPTVRNIMMFQRETYDNIKQLLYCDIKLYPELSDVMRPHLHGTLRIKNIDKFILNDYHYLITYGQMCIKVIRNDPKQDGEDTLPAWIEYCTKGQNIMKNYSTLYGYPLDNQKLFELNNNPTRNLNDYDIIIQNINKETEGEDNL